MSKSIPDRKGKSALINYCHAINKKAGKELIKVLDSNTKEELRGFDITYIIIDEVHK